MSMTIDALVAEAEALAAEERVELIDRLWGTIPERRGRPAIFDDPAFQCEVARRMASAEPAIPWETVRDELRRG